MNKDLLIRVLQELNTQANSNYDSTPEDMSTTLQAISFQLELLIDILKTQK